MLPKFCSFINKEFDMPDPKETLEVPKSPESPLVFISHDSRDAELAEAFSKLLRTYP
jgi:hypothetical protein